MSAAQHADVDIERNEITASMAPVLERIAVPVRYAQATAGNLGAAEEMEAVRASLEPCLAADPDLTVAAKVPGSHSKILSRDRKAVADAVRASA